MKKNGFTLLEMLGVLILIALVATIAIPVVKNNIDDSKNKLYNSQISYMIDGVKHWADENIFLLPLSESTIKLTLAQLKQSGNALEDIKNPKNNKCFSNSTIFNITKKGNNFTYQVDSVKNIACDKVKDVPIITLNGDIIEYLNLKDTYIDKGATAKSSNGTDLTSEIKTTISGSGTSINTSSHAVYYITYTVKSGDKETQAIRTVIVDDK